MKYSILMSIVLLVVVVSGAMLLGACSEKTNQDIIYESDK